MSTCLLWFRQDLRLSDNPAYQAALNSGQKIVPVYIHDPEDAGNWAPGGASKWWLHHSLKALNETLDDKLVLLTGKANEILPQLIKEFSAQAVFWNRCYEPWRIPRDKQIKADLAKIGIHAESFNSALLWEPWDILKKDGTPYKVFTPFYRKGCLGAGEPEKPSGLPKKEPVFQTRKSGLNLSALGLLPEKPEPRWDKKMEQYWQIGEQAAHQCLDEFLRHGLKGYKLQRNIPGQSGISRLSPYLHFGEISPRQVWHRVRHYATSHGLEGDADAFLSELGWREFSHHLLYHFPSLPEEPLQSRFANFPWAQNYTSHFQKWKDGKTGYPIVDAGMRELWETGFMHNRVRMVVGSFLVKHLRIPWQKGEEWFWDCLVDADLASNAFNWQWIAGCGADAAPYFRVFNPFMQGEKFDTNGSYVRKWCPEIAKLPDKVLHRPWEASASLLKDLDIHLGKTYPKPIVEHQQARDEALEAFKKLKG